MIDDVDILRRDQRENLLHSELDQASVRAEYGAFPKSLFIHFSDACNIDCVYCGRQVHERVQNGLMSAELFEKEIGPYLHLLDIVQLYGTGEPMLHPHFLKIVELCKASGTQVMTTSNMMLVNEARAERIVTLGLDQIIVSMDGCTPDVFAKLRGGADLDKVKANVKLVAQAKQRHGKTRPFLELACVVSRANVHQLAGMVRMAHELGCGLLRFYNVVLHKPEHYNEDVSKTWRFRWNMNRAKRLAERLGIVLEYIYQHPFPETDKVLHPPGLGVHKRCVYTINSPVVGKTGEVFPCCLSHYSYGKLGQDGTLWDILNNERATDFRRGLITGDYDPGCAKCGLLSDWTPDLAIEHIEQARRQVEAAEDLSDAQRNSLLTRIDAERHLVASQRVAHDATKKHSAA